MGEALHYEALRHSVKHILKRNKLSYDDFDIDNIVMLASCDNSSKEHLREYYSTDTILTVKELYINND